MRNTRTRRLAGAAVAAIAIAACSSDAGSNGDTTTGDTSPVDTATTDDSDGTSPQEAADNTTTPPAYGFASWDDVVAEADGQTVRWYLWGGSDAINNFVDDTYGPMLADTYGITLERVPVADTVDAVNQVLATAEAGEATGAVDLIWINGENFATLRNADLLYTEWAQELPNSALVAWDDPALNRDFGVPVDQMESPWSSAQLQMIANTDAVSLDDVPRSYAELTTWACDNPGRFTYVAPGPGGFQGTRFVKQALFELSGDAEMWAEFDQALWDEWSPQLWDYLNELEPCLWRDGQDYPESEGDLHALLNNSEVDFSITQEVVGASGLITQGLVPEASRAYVFDANSIGDFNYVAIPASAPNVAAALVTANLLLEPSRQALQILPENGFGLGFGIDPSLVEDAELRATLEAAALDRGDAATPIEDLNSSRVADSAPEYQQLVEDGWRDFVANE